MIHNIDANLVNKIPPEARDVPRQAVGQAAGQQAVRLDVRYDWVTEALTLAEDPDAVARARGLLASGQLDTIENIRQAAREIIDLGF
ncbi:MAG: hypothetical protein QHH07_07115 [Sedimentisphaerales bacterium]|jgi:predicted TIM-barrel fold metal-dependent hydrolase|nr:hypothetical protein [Sedimentisphaerales bacterium]